MKKEKARTAVLALGMVLGPFALPMNALATDVSGEINQDTTWTLSGSPYIITGDVTVNDGYTLTIEPGVSAKFEAATRLIILGKLVAKGTDTDRILFTSNDPAPTKGSWGGIVAPGVASIRFATIEHADSGLSAAGGISDGPFPHVTISDSLLRNNTRGFAYYAYVESTVDRCTFENNTDAVVGQVIVISNSVFTNNEYGVVGYSYPVNVYSSTFSGNQVALLSRDTRGEVKYSTISGNGTGVQGSYVSLSYNTIAANTIGIMPEFALPLGPLDHNNIYLNTTYNVQTGLFGVDATNDWWGTTDTPAIDAGIYDRNDDSTLGLVTYQPFLAQPVDITLPSPPANDDFDNATVITATGLPFSAAMLDTRGATTAADDPDDAPGGSASGYPYASVWYAFTPTENMSVTISTAGSDYDASVKVFTGVRGALTRVTSSPEFAFRALAHTTYYFMIHDSSGLDGIGGTLVFALNDLRTNDDFDHATVIAGLPFSITLDTSEATTAADDPTSCSGNLRATVWYSFTPAEDTWLTASTAGSDFYSLLAVFTGARGALSLVACGAGNTAFRAAARTTYYFMISSGGGSDLPGGTLVFALHGIPALHITPTISGTGSFDPRTGVAKISGTVDCSAAAAVSFFNGLLQRRVGQFVISGPIPDFTVANCSGTIPWSATVNPTNGKFRGGPATATLSWSAYDLGGTGQYVTGTATAKIHLKGGH